MNRERSDACGSDAPAWSVPSMGDLVLTLLAGTLSALRDRLFQDGFAEHGEVVADLVDVVDDYMAQSIWAPEPRPPRAV